MSGPLRFDEVLVETTAERWRAAAIAEGELVDWLDVPRRMLLPAGTIVLGRVSGSARDLGAVFVDIGGDKPALLDAKSNVPEAGSAVVVQIVEPPSADKGGRVTRRLALVGRHVVLLPGGKGVNASRRLDAKSAAKLIAQTAKPDGVGMMLRWTAATADIPEIGAEVARLGERARAISAVAERSQPPCVLHDEGDGVRHILREFGAHGAPAFVFNDRAGLRAAQTAAKDRFPELGERLSLGEANLFDRHDVASTIASAADVVVRLPSGGNIAIETTRVGTTVDVDSGSASGDGRAKLKTNLEAAREVARQLWLRDIGGMVIVDFIRMDGADERRRVVDALTAATSSDRIPVKVEGWTRAGLLELIRRRGRGGASE